jgi:hypothetical protein
VRNRKLLLRAKDAIATGQASIAESARGRNLRELQRLKSELAVAERKLASAISVLLMTHTSRSDA